MTLTHIHTQSFETHIHVHERAWTHAHTHAHKHTHSRTHVQRLGHAVAAVDGGCTQSRGRQVFDVVLAATAAPLIATSTAESAQPVVNTLLLLTARECTRTQTCTLVQVGDLLRFFFLFQKKKKPKENFFVCFFFKWLVKQRHWRAHRKNLSGAEPLRSLWSHSDPPYSSIRCSFRAGLFFCGKVVLEVFISSPLETALYDN